MEYYRLPIYVIFGILPSVVWLFYYARKDLHPEPKKMIAKVFLYGALITIPVFIIQVSLSLFLKNLQSLGLFTYPLLTNILKWFVIIAFTEELLKYLVVKFAVLKSKELDEPLDVMLYMVVAALGFAAVENILYLLSPLNGLSFIKATLALSFIRLIGATFLHTLCSALLGYFLALSFLKPVRRSSLTLAGLVLATLLHGSYNFSIINFEGPFNFIIPAIIILGLAAFMIYDFDEVKKIKAICKL